MPLDVLGCTRDTMAQGAGGGPGPEGRGKPVRLGRAGDRRLQLLVLNEEFLVSAGHQAALTTSLPFVHTARRYYRLEGLVSGWGVEGCAQAHQTAEHAQT